MDGSVDKDTSNRNAACFAQVCELETSLIITFCLNVTDPPRMTSAALPNYCNATLATL